MAILNLTKINGVDAVDVLVSQITHYEHYDEGGYTGRRGEYRAQMNPGCRKCNYYLPNHAQCLHEFDVRKGLEGACGQFRDRTPMEVKPSRAGTFIVSLFQHTPERLFIHDVALSTDGAAWDYKEYAERCYVCFIHSKVEEPNQ